MIVFLYMKTVLHTEYIQNDFHDRARERENIDKYDKLNIYVSYVEFLSVVFVTNACMDLCS